MPSAPAHLPAITLVSLPAGLHPAEGTRVTPNPTFSSISFYNRACSADAITGASPAHDTRFGSSKLTRARDHSWDSTHRECPVALVGAGLPQSRFFQPSRHFLYFPLSATPVPRMIVHGSKLGAAGPTAPDLGEQNWHYRSVPNHPRSTS